jgi:bifunctional enzyme CysN/CysC
MPGATPELDRFLDRYSRLELLRFMTCGSVDHGKSTLIGRLLYDSGNVADDTLDAAKSASARHGGGADAALDFAFLVDGLRAEREQGITIDVAYRYFATARRRFIIADAPGHEQYTGNMATAASHCDLAVVLIDAREGVVAQTRRHVTIAAVMGVKHVVVAVNKMDLAGWDESRFDDIRSQFTDFCARLELADLDFIPMSARSGENVVNHCEAPWYGGRTLLDYLESVHIASDRNLIDLRYPVQAVLRSADGERRVAGSLASGVMRTGDEVLLLPRRTKARISSIRSGPREIGEAFAPMPVSVAFDSEIDAGRGDVLAHIHNVPTISRDVEAMVVWLSETAAVAGESDYVVKHASRECRCRIAVVRYRLDIQEIRRANTDTLQRHEIGRLHLTSAEPLVFDSYARNRVMGAFILIDRVTSDTIAAGMIVARETSGDRDTAEGPRFGHDAFVISLSGGAGECAVALQDALATRGCFVVRLEQPVDPRAIGALTHAGAIVIVASSDRAGRATIHVDGDLLFDEERGAGEELAGRVVTRLRESGRLGDN